MLLSWDKVGPLAVAVTCEADYRSYKGSYKGRLAEIKMVKSITDD